MALVSTKYAPTNAFAFGSHSVEKTITRWLDELFPECLAQWSFEPLGEPKSVDDSPARFLARDDQASPRAMVFVASKCSPQLVARGAEYANAARELLGAEFGQPVQCALRSGFCAGLSVAVYPWRLRTSSNFVLSKVQRKQIQKWLLQWLRGVAMVCVSRYPEPDDQVQIQGLLQALGTCTLLGADIQQSIERALIRLERGCWRPRSILDHNDLWHGNVMLNRDQLNRPAGPSPFVIIDWAGASRKGGGFIDLVRVVKEFGVSERQLRVEVACHCEILGLEVSDAVSQLLVSFARLYQNLEFFPVERFVTLATESCRTLRRSLGKIGH